MIKSMPSLVLCVFSPSMKISLYKDESMPAAVCTAVPVWDVVGD